MSDRRALIGKTWSGWTLKVEPEHTVAYAQATGDDRPAYHGDAAIAPPMFHVRLMKELLFAVMMDPELDLDMLRLVHGEHAARFVRPIRVGELVDIHGELLDVVDKSSGLLVTAGLYGDVGGERVVDCTTAFFIRAPRDPNAPKRAPRPAPVLPPAPDFEATVQVPDDASYVYAKASLDNNPIHIDPAVAKRAGLPDVILQGLCTMAMTVRAAVDGVGDGDPAGLASASVRFARPVLNGQTLTVRGWKEAEGWALETLGPDGKAVISQAEARFR